MQETVPLPDEQATAALAARIARCARAGDLVALSGPLGAGKTAFARAFIGALGGTEEVPSPTFSLVQTYRLDAVEVWHFDLYRLESADEVLELGFEDALATGIVLAEWPDRLGDLMPADRLDIRLDHAEGGGRIARLEAHGSWTRRLAA